MRWSQYYLPTLKEDPKDAEVASHKLMMRAGMVRKLAAGIYSYLPFGLKALSNVEGIIREEMNKAGAIEVLLPALQPLDLWQRSGRDKTLVDDVGFSFDDRHNNSFVLGPTHEEVITELVAGEVKSYKELPLNLYQIQVKFRDEPRPRFGVIRSKEFIMKDAYSFDKDKKGLDKSYKIMEKAYCRIMERGGLDYLMVEADPGMMGGKESAEFMVVSESGEDSICLCPKCSYAASTEAAACLEDKTASETKARKQKNAAKLEEIDTPGVYTVEDVCKLFKVKPESLIKTLIYKTDNGYLAALIRGDNRLNEAKLQKAMGAQRLCLADDKEIKELTGAPVGFSGPVGLKGKKLKVIADYRIKAMGSAICGANKKDKHLKGVEVGKDFMPDTYADIRYIEEGDSCPKCRKPVQIKRTMELGHIFKLGTRYSEALKARFLDKDGREKPMIMGCYGIGVNRMLAAIIELNHDKDGIIWPLAAAPFKAEIVLLDASGEALKLAEGIYEQLTDEGLEVLLDDRDVHPGVKFKDADLIGLPYQLIIGSRGLKSGKLEIKERASGKRTQVKPAEAAAGLKKVLTA